MRQEIGLGAAKSIVNVEIFWPTSGITQTFKKINPDSCYTIREDSPEPVLVKLKTFKLGAGMGPKPHAHHDHLKQ